MTSNLTDINCFIAAKLRRLNDKEAPLSVCLEWENEKIPHSRLVIQENETGEIMVSFI